MLKTKNTLMSGHAGSNLSIILPNLGPGVYLAFVRTQSNFSWDPYPALVVHWDLEKCSEMC